MPRRVVVVLAFLTVWPADALAGKFGGFAKDGKRFLEEPHRVCEPLAVVDTTAVSGKPSCRNELDPNALEAHDFSKPAATTALSAKVRRQTLEITRAEAVVLRWETPHAIARVSALYLSTAEDLLAVEYMANNAPGTVVFRLPAPPTSTPAGGAAPAVTKDRLARTWEQRLVPCEQAGVKLELKTTGKFRVGIETRCQAERDKLKLAGAWELAADGRVALRFPQDEGPDESMMCEISTCGAPPGEDCLRCADEDVSFLLLPRTR